MMGWYSASYRYPDMGRFMAEYQPIIDAIERGETMSEDHPAVKQMVRESDERFGEDQGYMYLGGVDTLAVREVVGPYCITEYDGSEGVQTLDEWLEGAL